MHYVQCNDTDIFLKYRINEEEVRGRTDDFLLLTWFVLQKENPKIVLCSHVVVKFVFMYKNIKEFQTNLTKAVYIQNH